MRRWLRVFVVGGLSVMVSIDSASACRLFRGRCRPRSRVVSCRIVRPVQPTCGSVATCQPCGSVVHVESLPQQCCVPADGSAHAVVVDTQPGVVISGETPSAPTPGDTPVVVEAPRPATPKPVSEPLEPLTPIAPASAEKPLLALPPATEPAPVPQPQFKSAAEILAESAEKERLEKAAAEAAKPAAPVAEPPMKKEAPTEPAPLEPAPEVPAPAPLAEESEPAPKKPAPKPAAENFFDEDGDEPAEKPANEDKPPMKKESPRQPVEDLFGEPETKTPSTEDAPKPAEEPAEKAPSKEPTEKTEDDPFAVLDASPEPVRRWIDSSGLHETIGRLVEVHPDRVRILKRNGRFATVPMHRLSQHDQAYATAVGERLAGQSAAGPAVTDTARR